MNQNHPKQIDCWVIDEVVHQDAQLVIYKVHSSQKVNDKYYLGIECDFNCYSEDLWDDDFPFTIHTKPAYSYYNSHCFPIIPSSFSTGVYNTKQYFVFEKVNRSLSSILSDPTLRISEQDFASIALQILEILLYCFSRSKVLKNLGVNDFFLRKTTKGYRVILLNQDFYTNESYFIEDPTFTSLSVMNGNEPTPLDNLISFSYIMYYITSGSLPWIGVDDSTMKKMKESSCDLHFGTPLQFLHQLFTNSSLQHHSFIMQSIQNLREMYPKMVITFGKNVHSYKKKKKIDDLPEETYPNCTPPAVPNPKCQTVTPNHVVIVSGQKYEVKVVNGKRMLEPINSPLPRKQKLKPKLPPTVCKETANAFIQQTGESLSSKRGGTEVFNGFEGSKEHEKLEKLEKFEKHEKFEKLEKLEKLEKHEKLEKLEKHEILGKSKIPDKSKPPRSSTKRTNPTQQVSSKRRKVEIRHKSINTTTQGFLSSSLVSNLVLIAMVAALKS